MLEVLQNFATALFSFLDNPFVKVLLVGISTFLLRKWPKFVNEAAPAWTLIASMVITVIHSLFPDQAPTAHSLSLGGGVMLEQAGLFSGGGFLDRLLHEAVMPWLFGYGGQRATDHTAVWVKGRTPAEAKSEKVDTPPIPIKRFQTFVK